MFVKEKLKLWMTPLQALTNQTKICKICFKEFEITGFSAIFNPDLCICSRCLKTLKSKFIKFEINGCSGLAIYEYDEYIKKYLYTLKGCYDIELGKIFLNRYINELRLRFHNYILVPAPSDDESNKLRGFNHVDEIFSYLKLPIVHAIKKKCKHKQSEQSYKDRKKVKKYLHFDENVSIENKKILIVDDVMTTGSTITAMVDIIKQHHPKKISILVMSKRVLDDS